VASCEKPLVRDERYLSVPYILFLGFRLTWGPPLSSVLLGGSHPPFSLPCTPCSRTAGAVLFFCEFSFKNWRSECGSFSDSKNRAYGFLDKSRTSFSQPPLLDLDDSSFFGRVGPSLSSQEPRGPSILYTLRPSLTKFVEPPHSRILVPRRVFYCSARDSVWAFIPPHSLFCFLRWALFLLPASKALERV